MDELLKSYVDASEASAERERLGDLIVANADPIIRRAVSRRLAGL